MKPKSSIEGDNMITLNGARRVIAAAERQAEEIGQPIEYSCC
jgi:hypothetical protein